MVARQDLVEDADVRAGLLTARRGTAFFARKLSELSYADLDEPSLLPGWSRRHVIAHVGYNARAVARLVEWAATGVEMPMYSSPEARNEEIDFGATLPPIALQNLFDHSAIHLSVEWRDLPADKWEEQVRTAQGRLVPVSETVWMRTREVWLHAVDLDNGARFADIPAEVLRRLLGDIWGAWEKRGETHGLAARVRRGADDGLTLGEPEPGATLVEGPLAAVVRWAAGRGTEPGAPLTATHDGAHVTELPAAPRWI
ncbi:maleylpyruvate isomerase family mycothiol-dependent enzyme [Sinomonas sp. JGH33]|uniref:Maleylpyruvate isomerase family mycothiol-dependent enzyme n=1 Tax=Sinomonas terricola TaxID=3110330 RepID=A0ABU5T5U2_9MICC|nr:maleylpyruvate isomerase family mycothiol-dependent enzyme [Sinomonas sp. JGH33]MEA5455043.1 maleylpyruvate isomerase family mycothiol-dependent enzyme [Sinomonas sp. JGH33]